jgi:hypothetical protein
VESVEVEEVEETERTDPTEAIRIAVMAVGLALNLWIMWDYLKDRPEMLVLKHRMTTWWNRNVTDPERRARALRKAEAETVFEAMGVVQDGRD